ncbi:MAG: outer membrane protein assembly factor BamA [Desulfobacterales bacterium]
MPRILRGRLLPVLLAVILVMASHLLMKADAAAEIEPQASASKSNGIIFQGNTAISEAALRRAAAAELKSFDKEGHRPADIDDAAFQMELAYRNAGYAFAVVNYQIEKNETVPKITFLISEGPRVIVRDIIPIGNQALGDEKLRGYFQKDRSILFGKDELVFVRSRIEDAVGEIRRFYTTQGYLDAVVEAPEFDFAEDRSQVKITLRIQEGIPYTVHRIEISGDGIEGAQDDLDKIRRELINQPYFKRQRLLLQTRLLEVCGNYGYPDAVVEIDRRAGAEPGQVVLEAKISSGPRVTIEAIEVRGNERTRPDFIRNRMRLKPGDRYNLALQKESFRDLYRTGIFSKVDFELEKTGDPTKRALVVVVAENRAKELFFEPGWGSYEQLRLRVGFQEKNLFGTGRIFRTQATGSLKARSLSGGLTDPFFFNTDIKADLTGFYNHREEPSFTREDIGMAFALSKRLSDNLLSTAGYMIRSTDISDVDDYNEQSEGAYNYASIKGQLTYDTRNDLFFPTSGQRLFGSAEHADEFLGGSINLTRLTGGIRQFFSLARYTVLGFRYTTGLILPGSGQVTLPLSERFFNGGENTVRSFKESELGPKDPSGNPVGGYGFNVLNLELRQRLIGNLIGTVFVDYGNISPNRSRSERDLQPYESRSDVISDTFDDFFKDFRPGVGFGLQYLLPVGPARLDFAFNPDQRSQHDEDFFVMHFSIGTAF